MLRCRNSLFVLAVALCATAGQVRAEEVLKITPKCGKIGFVGAKNDGVHEGGFKKFNGTVKLVKDGSAVGQVTVEMETGSLWSDHPNLTAHLLNEDFFHVGKFPKAVFRTSQVRAAKPADRGGERSKVTHVLNGELTLLGVSQPVKVPATIQLKDETLLIDGTCSLDRTQFGMDYGLDKIHVEVDVSFSLKIPRKK